MEQTTKALSEWSAGLDHARMVADVEVTEFRTPRCCLFEEGIRGMIPPPISCGVFLRWLAHLDEETKELINLETDKEGRSTVVVLRRR